MTPDPYAFTDTRAPDDECGEAHGCDGRPIVRRPRGSGYTGYGWSWRCPWCGDRDCPGCDPTPDPTEDDDDDE